MDFGHRKMRMNVEGDRLSRLPDDLIHKILSFIDIREAIRTGVLSSRWRFIWTSMPYLNFSTEDFSTLPKFSKFATRVLSRRNNLADVHSMKLSFRGKVSKAFVKRILNYAFSHNIQQLNVVCLLAKGIEFPLSLFSSQSLKHLSLSRNINRKTRRHDVDSYFITPTSTWELQTLTTLDLHYVTLCDDEADKCIGVFTKCANLINLTLNWFRTKGSNGFSIVHPRLSNLTLENCCYSVKAVNVAAPQLQNLTIRFCSAEHVINAPYLASLLYKGHRPLRLSTDGFHSLEKADICVSSPQYADAHKIICLLQQFHNVHFLTLNVEIIEILSNSVDLILHQPSPFVNLKRLKFYPESLYFLYPANKKVTMSTKLKSYLLDSSPGSTFTMVLREEVKAQKIMAELGVILEKEKDNTKTNGAHLERGKAHVAESHKPKSKMELKIGENMAQIKSGWENLGVQLQGRKEKACVIISKLHDIEKLLTELPASNRAKIQPCFSSLCAEADIVISQITNCMKIQCDENQSHSSVSFHELATTLEPSS